MQSLHSRHWVNFLFGIIIFYQINLIPFFFIRPDVYRLNLEEGRFLNSFQTEATTLNACDLNPMHHLFVCGSKEGKVEAWDPRARNRVGLLDVALHAVTPDTQ